MKPKEKILILDFGSQYTQLIARRVREHNVYSEIVHFSLPVAEIAKQKPSGLVLSGGPSSVYEDGAPDVDSSLFELGVPVLGICYGMQLMGKNLGGKVQPGAKREYGKTEIEMDTDTTLFKGVSSPAVGWMSHGDIVLEPPPGFVITAKSSNSPVTAMADDKRKFYAVQFHPEVAHTPFGPQVLKNFLFDVCGVAGDWTIENFIDMTVRDVRERVGSERVLCGLSGGVDSSAVAAMIHEAIGDQLTCVFVDHGLLRKDEAKEVVSTFRDHFHINLIHVDVSDEFLGKLEGVSDPEKKRKIIGETFIRTFEREARKLGKIKYLAQGTLYPDVIESMAGGIGPAHKIKSHHNVGGLPEDMDFELIEPLRFLFKDEVRKVCMELSMPDHITWRQPFPGPGLAVRIIGDITREKVHILQEADAIAREEIFNWDKDRQVWQYFAVLPDIRSVGVMGDQRTYSRPIIIRAVSSLDGMTADWARLPYDLLERMATRIVNEVEGVNRVAYDITSKPPGTIEWE